MNETIEIAFDIIFKSPTTSKKNAGTIHAEDYAEALSILESRMYQHEFEVVKVYADSELILKK